MTKTFSVLALAVAVLIVAISLLIVDTQKVRARSTCPSGTQKFAHVCIENGPARAEDTFANASDTCAAAKRRLPTFAELDAFRRQPGITIGSTSGNRTFPEWTSEFTDLSTSIVGQR